MILLYALLLRIPIGVLNETCNFTLDIIAGSAFYEAGEIFRAFHVAIQRRLDNKVVRILLFCVPVFVMGLDISDNMDVKCLTGLGRIE